NLHVLPVIPQRRSSDLQRVTVIGVIDHDAGRLRQAIGRSVGQPVDAFEASTVAQMEARDRIEGLELALFIDQITGTQTWQCILRSEEHTSELQSRENLV